MHRILSVLIWSAIAALPTTSFAADVSDAFMKEFFNAHGCNACHGVDELRIGPSYRSIAARYRTASPETIDALRMKVRYGGAGSWGIVPMISNPSLSDAQIRLAITWILGLRDAAPVAVPRK